MRPLTAALSLAMLWPLCARAQSAADLALANAAFVNPGVSVAADPFAAPTFVGQPPSATPAVTSRVAAAGQGLIAWQSSTVSRPAGGGAVDTVRLTVVGVSRSLAPRPDAAYDTNAVDVAFIRGWPNAMMLRGGGLGLNISPHAGFGLDSAGGNHAEAGAMFRLSSVDTAVRDRLAAMGVKTGDAAYGDRGRWYLFAAVRGQSVGLNMMADGGALRRAGWSTDASSALVGDGQLGVGWRKGGMEASFGYVHRDVKLINTPYGASDSMRDSLAALSLTFHPGW